MVPHPPPRRIENPRGWIADRLALMGRNLRLEVPKGCSAQVAHSGGGGIEGPEGVHPAAARAHVAGERRLEGPKGTLSRFPDKRVRGGRVTARSQGGSRRARSEAGKSSWSFKDDYSALCRKSRQGSLKVSPHHGGGSRGAAAARAHSRG